MCPIDYVFEPIWAFELLMNFEVLRVEESDHYLLRTIIKMDIAPRQMRDLMLNIDCSKRLQTRLSEKHPSLLKELQYNYSGLDHREVPLDPLVGSCGVGAGREPGTPLCPVGLPIVRNLLSWWSRKTGNLLTIPCSLGLSGTVRDCTRSSSEHTVDPKTTGKRKHKRESRYIEEEKQTQKTLSFGPEAIIHPLSTEWIPYVKVAPYV
ncbi:hypothetical protein NDU88_005156 [Pleurodeles waltl]|uniref:Uncharacterized protein n=1 Tax=Pleurodeles waltl TaxID=8319 RepID=A0AAV7RLB1_PLEWA|nr:hypothetical protein NDU88_005156 [Pleurodeles waltl]